MNPWNEDRLREDSDVEEEPPSVHPAFVASPTPRRRRSSLGNSPSSLVSSPSASRSARRRSIASGHGRGGSNSRADAAHLAEEAGAAAAAAADRDRLEREAPIRGLAKQMSRMDMFSGNTKKGNSNSNSNSNSLPNHSRTNSGMSFLLSSAHGHHSRPGSRIDDGMLSAATSTTSIPAGVGASPGSRSRRTPPPAGPTPTPEGGRGRGPPAAAAAVVGAQTAAAVTASTVGGSGRQQQQQYAIRPGSSPISPRRLEEGNPGGGVGLSAGAPGAPGAAASDELRAAARARGAAASRPSLIATPETPPPLRSMQRRGSLVNRDVLEEESPKQQIEPELMIGEIQSIRLNDEIVLVRKALVVIVLSVVAALLVNLLAGALDDEVNILEVVCFVSILLLSFPVIRFTARLFAYIVTTRASALLYRGNRYYFVVALHYDIAITIWSILSVVVWQQLFHRWVYTDEVGAEGTKLSRSIFRHGDSVLQCHLALRVGILTKNFLVLLVATSYLWRPYLQRVQSSILAQYILLLLTDYCTKGYCNPGDQRFAIEMGRQGIKEDNNISLYAVSKAMGFIPRNKLGHSFFRQLAGSDTLDSSRDATTLGNFLFDQLILRSCPQPESSLPPFSSPQRRSLASALTGGATSSIRSTRSRESGVSRALPRFGVQLQKRNSESAAAAAATTATGPRSPNSPRFRSSMSDVPRAFGKGGLGGDGGGGAGAAAGAAPFGRGSGKVSSTLGKLLPVTERADFSSVSSGVEGTGTGAGGGGGGSGVAGPLSRAAGGSGGRAKKGGGAAAAVTPTTPVRSGARGRGTGGQEGASGPAAAVDGAQQGSGRASPAPGDDAGGAAVTGSGCAGGRPDGKEGPEQAAAASASASTAPSVPVEGVSKERAQDLAPLARDRSALTGSTRSVASSSNLSDKDSGVAGGGGGGAEDRQRQGGNGAGNGKGKGDGDGATGKGAEGKKEEEGDKEDEDDSDEEEEEEEQVLVRKTLCPALEPELLDVAFKIFDLDGSGTVTKEEMVLGVVGTFKDHRSLAHTLQDSEHIARKLGLIIMWVILFILFFVWLSIWGADVVSLSVTFASFLIAFSFMIGTAASNLMSAVLFIFVSRLYDVGDRVHIYNNSMTKGVEPTNLTVVKVDLMTTVFKRWDEQVFYMPNHLLATKTIVNIQRTAHQWHEFMIQIAASTQAEKLVALQTSLQAFSKSKDKPEGLYTRMGFSLTGIEDSTKLTIRITFRQRGNWQNMEKKWACQSMCTWAIKNACDKLHISYSLPEVPLRLKNKLL